MTNKNFQNIKIHPTTYPIIIKDCIKRIELGFELIGLDDVSERDRERLSGAIIVSPDYQREYSSNDERESLLIESILVGIPIPAIFLASSRFKNVRVMNVVDGQHRLMAFFRFLKNEFKLEGMKIRTDLDGESFSSLNYEDKSEIADKQLAGVLFDSFPGKWFELQVFSRYNHGTKPLSQQDIRNAVYGSRFNDYVNRFIRNNLLESNNRSELSLIYNVTKDRAVKKKVHESVFVILSILEKGIEQGGDITKSPEFADTFMEEKSKKEEEIKDLEDSNKHSDAVKLENSFSNSFNMLTNNFEKFNIFLVKINEWVEYPVSKEIYGLSNRNYKFQISIGMILSGIFKRLIDSNCDLNNINYIKFLQEIKNKLSNSFLEDPNYNASSTNPKEISKLVNLINIDYFSKKEV